MKRDQQLESHERRIRDLEAAIGRLIGGGTGGGGAVGVATAADVGTVKLSRTASTPAAPVVISDAGGAISTDGGGVTALSVGATNNDQEVAIISGLSPVDVLRVFSTSALDSFDPGAAIHGDANAAGPGLHGSGNDEDDARAAGSSGVKATGGPYAPALYVVPSTEPKYADVGMLYADGGGVLYVCTTAGFQGGTLVWTKVADQ